MRTHGRTQLDRAAGLKIANRRINHTRCKTPPASMNRHRADAIGRSDQDRYAIRGQDSDRLARRTANQSIRLHRTNPSHGIKNSHLDTMHLTRPHRVNRGLSPARSKSMINRNAIEDGIF